MKSEEVFSTKRLEQQVSAYCRRYGITPAFPTSPLWNIEDGYRRNLQFPDAGATGCYAIYSKDGDLLYIGKASLSHTLGARLYSYFTGIRSPVPGNPKGDWKKPPKYIQTIKVNEPFEAPSLEEFLILKLQPFNNVRKGRAS